MSATPFTHQQSRLPPRDLPEYLPPYLPRYIPLYLPRYIPPYPDARACRASVEVSSASDAAHGMVDDEEADEVRRSTQQSRLPPRDLHTPYLPRYLPPYPNACSGRASAEVRHSARPLAPSDAAHGMVDDDEADEVRRSTPTVRLSPLVSRSHGSSSFTSTPPTLDPAAPSVGGLTEGPDHMARLRLLRSLYLLFGVPEENEAVLEIVSVAALGCELGREESEAAEELVEGVGLELLALLARHVPLLPPVLPHLALALVHAPP
eukprot:CAMPEP_0202856124 /NCGR_PEP_ID=MMETSP1389-20130828/91871_1 /ASSEMBLY_ACC=CAM_ASM_000865 /TAXON_ID=302021 /ORGANISM="Rhodomonas sp., Strain CCMP768" /LENGTH=262 /DNA_ID=CAMNT_0049534765 /DNA_START=111 /DNA_END=895 /DNA_ORIENTATION=-